MPDVVGADVAAAARRLRNDGFKPVVERVRNDQPARRRSSRQDPRPGTELEVGSEVTLTVSDGPGTRAVPDVEGLTARGARGRGCATPASRCASASEAQRRRRARTASIRTPPPIGLGASSVGATVTLVVSSGPEQVAVPDVVGERRRGRARPSSRRRA